MWAGWADPSAEARKQGCPSVSPPIYSMQANFQKFWAQMALSEWWNSALKVLRALGSFVQGDNGVSTSFEVTDQYTDWKRGSHCLLKCSDVMDYIQKIRELENQQGWKRPSRPSSPIIHLPPLFPSKPCPHSTAPKCFLGMNMEEQFWLIWTSVPFQHKNVWWLLLPPINMKKTFLFRKIKPWL